MPVDLTERWDEIRSLFESALEQEPAARDAWLTDRGVDAEVRAEVLSLIACHDQPHALLDRPVVALDEVSPNLPPHYEIGDYRIGRLIGHGGMGTVYLGHRADDAFDRQVAIKVIRHSLGSRDALRRFLTERQTLAGLDHPNIARLLDGGTTRDQLPFFVMEYVDGTPIDTFCAQHQLALVARLELFLRVASAVQHAHEHLVVHRDLKPDNVLVRADGVPKLLDFGIAKTIAAGSSTAATLTTRAMTARYASPEQVRNESIGTTSDVYSLGVLLYQLVTGGVPFGDETSTDSDWQIERHICETAPANPSERARAAGQPWAPRLSGDLDAIILMALRKEPDRRYRSVAQFAEDIERHLQGRPVAARPDSLGYRTRKFVGRNRLATVAAAAALIALAGGIVMTSWSASLARSEARRAQAETARAQRVSEFLRTVIALPNPTWNAAGTGGRNDMTVLDLLKAAGDRIDRELGSDPEMAADLHHTLGNTYRARGLFAEAEHHLATALAIRQRVLDPHDPKVAESLFYFGASQFWFGRKDVAERYFHEAIAIERRLPEAQAGQLPYILLDLPSLPSYADLDKAQGVLSEAMALLVRRHGPDHMTVGIAKQRLAQVELRRHNGAAAKRLLEEALAIIRKQSVAPIDEAATLQDLGLAERMQGDLAEAARITRDALDRHVAAYGADHPSSVSNEWQLASILAQAGRYADASPHLEHIIEVRRRRPQDVEPAKLEDIVALAATARLKARALK
jgi:tetratricopeptide (TPR) repeat protein